MNQTKLRPPLEPREFLDRPRLTVELEAAASAPLVLVTGVAGVGKTTVVRRWASSLAADVRLAWLTVDVRDNDPVRFWSYFAGALALCCPDWSWTVAEAVNSHDIDVLAERLQNCGPLVVVLDDLHFLVDPTVLEQLDQLADAMGGQTTLILVCRSRPPLRLARRSTTSKLGQIHGSDLLFTPEETNEVLDLLGERASRGGTANREWRDSVHDLTGGWPIAVTLSAQLAERAPGSGPALARRRRRQVADYLTEEVLRSFPAAVQRFLLDTCVLDEITVKASNAVRLATDSARYISALEDHDAFLTPLDADGAPVWRHHAIVRDHLRRRLEDEEPDRWAALNLLAAQYHAERDVEVGVDHALYAKDWAFAADLVELVTQRSHGAVEVGRRLRWLAALPDAVLGERRQLRAYAVNLGTYACRPDLARRWIKAGRPDGSTELPDLVVEGWQAAVAGDMTALGEIATLGAERSTPSSESWFSFVLGRLVAEVSRGELVAAAESATLIRTMPDSCRPELWGPQEYVWSEIAVLRARMGDLAGADLALADLDEWLVRARALGYPGEALHACRAQAVVALLQGDLDRAGYWTVLPDLEVMRGGRIFLLVEAMLDQVGILRALGARDQCIALLAQVRVMVDQMADAAGYRGWLEQEEAEAGRGLQATGDRPGGGVLGAASAGDEPLVDAGSQAGPGECDSLLGRSAGASTGSGPAPAALLQPAPAPRASTPGPQARRAAAGVVVEPLSRRELEVLCMLRSEFSLPEIAAHLYVSYSTVKTHTRAIYRKLGVRGRSAAVARGRQFGYL